MNRKHLRMHAEWFRKNASGMPKEDLIELINLLLDLSLELSFGYDNQRLRITTLKARLKKYENRDVEIRKAMLKEREE